MALLDVHCALCIPVLSIFLFLHLSMSSYFLTSNKFVQILFVSSIYTFCSLYRPLFDSASDQRALYLTGSVERNKRGQQSALLIPLSVLILPVLLCKYSRLDVFFDTLLYYTYIFVLYLQSLLSTFFPHKCMSFLRRL